MLEEKVGDGAKTELWNCTHVSEKGLLATVVPAMNSRKVGEVGLVEGRKNREEHKKL